MATRLVHGRPAGEESDSDEWDLGNYCTKTLDIKKEDADTVVPEKDKLSRFKSAIATGAVHAAEQLLDSGVDVETMVEYEMTPLMCAVHKANYDMSKMLLDRGASSDYTKDGYTVLMVACTATASEDKIVQCVDLLLSRNADPNVVNGSKMTCLMMAARDGYCNVIHTLVSHGAEVNSQDSNGYTALSLAVQGGREKAVLKLLQLGADKTIESNKGMSPATLAQAYRQTQISRILAASSSGVDEDPVSSREANLVSNNTDPPASKDSSQVRLCDVQLLLHGLKLEHLSDIITENDITWSSLVTMEKEDLEKIGITEPEDQSKVLAAVQEMLLDTVDLDTLNQLDKVDIGSEELYNFLISLRQQCCYLTEMVQDALSRFPRRASELVLSLDPKKEAQVICNQLVAQTGDLQKEVICLRNLLREMDPARDPCLLPRLGSHGDRRKKKLLSGVTLSVLGAGLLLLVYKSTAGKVHL